MSRYWNFEGRSSKIHVVLSFLVVIFSWLLIYNPVYLQRQIRDNYVFLCKSTNDHVSCITLLF